MKKLIGLIPLYDDDKDSYWMLPRIHEGSRSLRSPSGYASVNDRSRRTG